MKVQEKLDRILIELNKYKEDGNYYNLCYLLADFEEISSHDSFQLAKSLEMKGYIKCTYLRSGASGTITLAGIDYLEKNNLLEINSYSPNDKFQEVEKAEVSIKLDEILEKLCKLELGQQIIHDSFENEFEILKSLLNILGKKEWKQVLIGKLVDAGLGKVADEVFDVISSVFDDNRLLN